MCPGPCNKRLMPAIVASSMRNLCGLCGRHCGQCGLRQQVVTCCQSHTFCTECLAEHIKTSIRLKTRFINQTFSFRNYLTTICMPTTTCPLCSPVCPRASECRYTLAVPEVKDILEENIRTAASPNLARSTAYLLRT